MIWFKHPNNLPNDKRLAALIDKEGSRGYGMYMYIIEMLGAQPDGRLGFGQLKVMARKGFPRKYMEKIIREYRLFTLCGEEEFESAIDFNSKGNTNHLQNDLKTSAKTVNAENEDKPLKNSSNTEKTCLARVRRDKNREENIKRKDAVVVQKRDDDGGGAFAKSCNEIPEICCNNDSGSNSDFYSCDDSDSYDNEISRSDASENSNATSGNDKSASNNNEASRNGKSTTHGCDNTPENNNASGNSRGTPGNGKSASNSNEASRNYKSTPHGCDKETFAESSTPKTLSTSWEKQVDDLSKNRAFRELVCMKSNFSILLDRHFDAALEEFKKHIILLGKEEKMDSREEVRSYFTYYTRAGQRTSHELHTRLLELDARRQTAQPDPYRYEQLVDGKRTYLGCPLPDEAPPRPDSTSFWMETTCSWASPRQPAATRKAKLRPD